jgi:hypothetical protein
VRCAHTLPAIMLPTWVPCPEQSVSGSLASSTKEAPGRTPLRANSTWLARMPVSSTYTSTPSPLLHPWRENWPSSGRYLWSTRSWLQLGPEIAVVEAATARRCGMMLFS